MALRELDSSTERFAGPCSKMDVGQFASLVSGLFDNKLSSGLQTAKQTEQKKSERTSNDVRADLAEYTPWANVAYFLKNGWGIR